MNEKQVHRGYKIATIAFVIMSIILVGVIFLQTNYYTGRLNEKDKTITSLNNTVILQNDTIVSLKSQVANLTGIINLSVSTILVDTQTVSQGASQSTSWTFSVNYAGCVSIKLLDFGPTRTDSAIVEATYYSHGVSYNSGKIWLHIGDTAYFPVLPTTNLTIKCGNGYWFNGATETVTISYQY